MVVVAPRVDEKDALPWADVMVAPEPAPLFVPAADAIEPQFERAPHHRVTFDHDWIW